MLLFQDGSLLLISEREAEIVLRAVCETPTSELSACLVNLAMCRWTAASPSQAWAHVPLAVGPLPSASRVPPSFTCAIICAQLFSGETEYLCDTTAAEADGNGARRRTLIDVVIGQGSFIFGTCSRERVDAVEELVAVRGRGHCWPGSDLETICSEEITRRVVHRSRGSMFRKIRGGTVEQLTSFGSSAVE